MIALLRCMLNGDGNLSALLPTEAYRMAIGGLRILAPLDDHRQSARPRARGLRSPQRDIPQESDLMVYALDPLIGNSIFVSSGDPWQRQRDMIDPALTMMRVGKKAFPAMEAGAAAAEGMLADFASRGEVFSLDMMMSHMTADIIFWRTVFSSNIDAKVTHDVFDAFTVFERSVAQVEIRRLIMDKAWTRIPQKESVLAACRLIRRCSANFWTAIPGMAT